MRSRYAKDSGITITRWKPPARWRRPLCLSVQSGVEPGFDESQDNGGVLHHFFRSGNAFVFRLPEGDNLVDKPHAQGFPGAVNDNAALAQW